jgi:serine/threonine-protein kinase
MHKDPARRYASAEALLRDVDHYLHGEPLEARPDALAYRAGKFLKRNRTPVAATAAGLLSLVGVAAFYTYRLARARDAAVTQAARAQRMQALMSNLLTGGEDAAAPADTLRVLDVVDRGVLEAETLTAEPVVQADLFHTLGSLYHSLGRFADADTLLDKALTRRCALFGADSAEVADTLVARGLLRLDQGQFDEAEQLTREALAIVRRRLPHGDPRVAKTATALGQVLEERGGYAEAVPVLEEAVRMHETQTTASPDLASSLRHLGSVHFYAGNLDTAAGIFDRVLAMTRQVNGERHALAGEDLINVGAVHFERGRYADAERFYREALQISEAWYGGEHHQTAGHLTMLARALVMQFRLDEAAPLVERAVAVRERVFGPMHPRVASAVNEAGSIALQRKRYDEAEAAFRRMGDIYRAAYPNTHYLHALATANLASVFNAKEEFATAEPLFRQAIAIYGETQGSDHPNVGIARVKLGRALLGQQRYAEAEAETLQGYDILRRQTSPSVSWLKAAREDLVKIYVASNRPDDAEQYRTELEATTPKT